MESDEPADELPTFCFQHSDNNFTSGILQFLYAPARNLRERVPAPDDDAWNLLLDDEVCTRRSFAIVRTRFQADIDGGTFQQGRVFHGTDGVDLSVGFSTAHMVSLAYDFPVTYYYRSHHRVGCCIAKSVLCQLDASQHIFLFF